MAVKYITTLYHARTNHNKKEQKNQSVSSLRIYLIAWIRKGMKSLKHSASIYKFHFDSTTQGKGAKGQENQWLIIRSPYSR